jgi:hypothetical protein
MKKVVLTMVIAFSVVFLCNAKVGFTQEGMEKRLDYLESRISELTTVQEDNTSTIDSLKGLQDKVSLGFGLRTEYKMVEDAAGTDTDGVSGGTSWSKDFDVTNMRLYMGAKITDQITTTFNTEIRNVTGTEDAVRLLDAFAEYTWSDLHHIRFGRHLPASDRYNLDGPYYQNSYEFPFNGISMYAFKDTGRVEGISYWGQIDGGKFKYQFTAAEGAEGRGNNEDPDHLMYTGRLTFCLWEPEPGFYNSSAFYGAKDVCTIGLVGVHQSDGAGTAAKPTDYTAWNIDFLLEKTYDWGTIDIEAGYFDYSNHGTGGADNAGGSGATDSPFAGQGWSAGFSYLFPEKATILSIEGTPQIVTRYTEADPTGAGVTHQYTQNQLELALQYIIQPYNAKISLAWKNTHTGGAVNDTDWNEDRQEVKLGMQFQH